MVDVYFMLLGMVVHLVRHHNEPGQALSYLNNHKDDLNGIQLDNIQGYVYNDIDRWNLSCQRAPHEEAWYKFAYRIDCLKSELNAIGSGSYEGLHWIKCCGVKRHAVMLKKTPYGAVMKSLCGTMTYMSSLPSNHADRDHSHKNNCKTCRKKVNELMP